MLFRFQEAIQRLEVQQNISQTTKLPQAETSSANNRIPKTGIELVLEPEPGPTGVRVRVREVHRARSSRWLRVRVEKSPRSRATTIQRKFR